MSSISSGTGQRYIVEETIQVVVPDDRIGVSFFEKSPTRVSKIKYDSCFIGQLMSGDVILSVDGEPISSGDEFIAYCCRGSPPRNVTVKYRRDNYYKMVTIKRTESRTKRGETQGIYIQARWRPDLPLGMIGEHVIVVHVDPGSAAYQHFQYGDILEKVNDSLVRNTDGAKSAIRESIQNKRSVILKIVRNVKKKTQTEAAQDVRFIMRRNYGFWNRTHVNNACEDDPAGSRSESGEETNATGSSSGQRSSNNQRSDSQRSNTTRPNIYHTDHVETQQMRADEYGKQLVATPPRAGGTRDDNDDASTSSSRGS